MRYFILLTFSMLLFACSNSEKTPKVAETKTVENKTSNCLNIEVFEGTYPTVNGPAATITSQKIEGGCLVLELSYHGCKNTKFELLWNKMVKKSLPAQTSLFLKKTEVGGHCHENNVQMLSFDLEVFRKKHYGGKISLNIPGAEKGILYEYEL